MLFSTFLVSFLFKDNFLDRYLQLFHVFVFLNIVKKSFFNITLNLNTGSILLVLSCTRSTSEMLLKLGTQCFKIFAVIVPTGHKTLDFLTSTLKFIHIDYTSIFSSLLFLCFLLWLSFLALFRYTTFTCFLLLSISLGLYFTVTSIFCIFSIYFFI